MRKLLYLMFMVSFALADKNDNRRTKLPFVADAVGNTLPPPSSVPATVGSPVNLLTPDRYEFYTFDESGELVKRLMTLEEIQAIVAAGEETEGLVTFANDQQPTVAFNVNPPPYTKVHSVVENVQNVLKAQMEAHKNKPYIHPTLDTPDVSDSWSLILPSIFGNTGVDIVPDKSSGAVTTPDTETLEERYDDIENSLNKESDNNEIDSSKIKNEDRVSVTEIAQQKTTEAPTTKAAITTTLSTTTSTSKPLTTFMSTRKPIYMTSKITTSTMSPKKSTTSFSPITTKKPAIWATKIPASTTYTTRFTTNSSQTRNNNKQTSIIPVTSKPFTRTTPKTTTPKTEATTKGHVVDVSTTTDYEKNKIQIQPNVGIVSSTEKNAIEFEKISTFIPVVTYNTEHNTEIGISSIKPTITFASTTERLVSSTAKTTPTIRTTVSEPVTTSSSFISTISASSIKQNDDEKVNLTTVTTQSVSPSTTISSTEFLTFDNINLPENDNETSATADISITNNNDEPLPLFDVAQSISQIASDLGGDFQPLPTTGSLLDTTNVNMIGLESKENMDIDIPSGSVNETTNKLQQNTDENNINFVKISTIDPDNRSKDKQPNKKITVDTTTTEREVDNKKTNIIINTLQKVEISSTAATKEFTTIDPILFESMGDLMSQVVNEAPSVIDSDIKNDNDSLITTTEQIVPTTVIDISTTIKNILTDTTTTEKSGKIDENETIRINKTTEKRHDAQAAFINKTHIVTVSKINNNTVSITNETAKEHDFVQISNSTDTKIKEKTKPIKNKNNITNGELTHPPSDMLTTIKTVTQIPDRLSTKESIQEETIVHEATSKDVFSTTESLQQDVVRMENTIKKQNPSVSNISNTKDTGYTKNIIKKEKLPELLPKVDDFKKKIQKVNIDDEELVNQRNNTWKLIPTLSPPKANEIPIEKEKSDNAYNSESNKDIVLDYSNENQGLEVTTKYLEEDVARFTDLSNELAFRYWNVIIDDMDRKRSFVFSPYSTFSMLAMIFMGARGATSGEMNEILKLDDMVTFNPHFTLKNISDSIETSPQSGVAVSAFIRELYSDRNKGKILTFYKERAQHFYNGHVEEVNFKLISDIIRRRTNLLVKRYTWGKIPEYMKANNIVIQPPLAAFTTNIFQTDCSGTSVDGRDGEMYFVVSPNVRQRRLVPVPAVVYKKGFLAGYDPVLDVTVAALGNTNSVISTIFLMPGQQGNVVHVDDLDKLEKRLLEAVPTTPTWSRVLRTLLPRPGLELQIPRFSHKSTFNTSLTLKKMGLKDLFDGEHADLGGLNGPSKDLYLSDMVQVNTFATCGEGVIGEQHHIEEYPENVGIAQKRRARWLNNWDEPRDYQRAFHDPHDISDAMHLPLHLRPRQARLPTRSNQPARLKFDRPLLYFVRHNPSGMILYFGRYNPRLLP